MYVAKADGSEPVKVAGSDECAPRRPDWSPDGTQLAYTPAAAGGRTQHGCRVVVLDLATGQETSRRRAAPTGRPTASSWRRPPDSASATWTPTCGRSGSRTATLERVTQLGGGVDEPAGRPPTTGSPSRAGTRSAARPSPAIDQEIYIVDADGGSVRNLTNDDEECDPICRGRHARPRALVVARRAPDRVRQHARRADRPATTRRTTSQVWEMRPDGTGLRKRTSTPT